MTQIERLRKQHPKLVADLAGDKIGEFIDTLDFGKLRKFIEDSAVCTYGTFEVIKMGAQKTQSFSSDERAKLK
ncbi:MAG: hypothetical protein V6S10_03545 [Candidatus Methanoglobus sp.]